MDFRNPVFTVRCCAQRGDATSVRRLSVCVVHVYFSHRLKYFKTNFTAD